MDVNELNRGLVAILPEIILLLLGVFVILADVFTSDEHKRRLGLIATFGLVGTLVVVILQTHALGQLGGTAQPVLGGMLRVDAMAQLFRIMFITAAALTALMSIDFKPLKQGGEFYGLVIFATLGMGLMASANDIIMLYVALETTSISLYLLAGYLRENPRSSEAGIKYFLFGAFTSTIMLFGLSLVYGFTGQTEFSEVVTALSSLGQAGVAPTVVALLLILVGFGFKVAAVPFHMWTPDVYEGAPTPVTAFVSVASKAAGFAVMVRVFLLVFTPVQEQWIGVVAVLAAVTMTLGNLLAIPQKNIKRMLAYSSIGQAGYILIGVASVDAEGLGVAAVLFYLAAYVATNIAAFIFVEIITNKLGSEQISDMAGFSRRSFGLSLGMMLALLSLGGVPPLAGFFGKFYIFTAAVNSGLIWLAVVGVLNAIVGLYYYLIVIKVLFVDPLEGDEEPVEDVAVTLRIGLALSIIAVLFLGIFATPWYDLARGAAQALFGLSG